MTEPDHDPRPAVTQFLQELGRAMCDEQTAAIAKYEAFTEMVRLTDEPGLHDQETP